MQTTRVLHVIGQMNRAGAETMLMNLYKGIDRKLVQFDFIVFSDSKGDFDDEILELGGRIFRILDRNPLMRMVRLYKFLVKHREYKVIHTHTLFSNAMHLLSGYFARVPNRIAHSHSTWDISRGALVDFIYRNTSRSLINIFSTYKISCGKKAGEFLFKGDSEILYLPNAVDVDEIAEIGHEFKAYWKSEFGIGKESLKIVQIGRLEEVKNPKFSIKVASELDRKGVVFHMLFIGKGKLDIQIDELIRENNLLGKVRLTGLRSDISEIMAGANLLVMPSLYEGFPVVLVEAQAAGLKCLVSNSISDEVDLGLGLVHFESLATNAEDWANKLLELSLGNVQPSDKRRFVLTESGFNITTSAARLQSVYLNMTANA